MRKLCVALVLPIILLAGAATALAAEFGTAAEAQAMLQRAAAAIQAYKAKALDMFTKGGGGFKDRDLYPYCGGPDGKFTAHPTLVGQSLKDLKDKAGKPFGAEIYTVAEVVKIKEVAYMWPRPGQTEPVQKSVFVIKVTDQICAVGYYK